MNVTVTSSTMFTHLSNINGDLYRKATSRYELNSYTKENELLQLTPEIIPRAY